MHGFYIPFANVVAIIRTVDVLNVPDSVLSGRSIDYMNFRHTVTTSIFSRVIKFVLNVLRWGAERGFFYAVVIVLSY